MHTAMRLIWPLMCMVSVINKGCVGIAPPVPDYDDTSEIVITTQIFQGLNNSLADLLKHGYRRATFKSKYVYHDGTVSNNDRGGDRIQVDATSHVTDQAQQIAACTVGKMTKHTPPDVFHRLSQLTKVGIFTKAESMTVYPEFHGVANPPDCGSSCAGHCSASCTFDGRKFASIAGATNTRACIVDDNVLCNANDPYRSQANILVHEYSHAIQMHGLDAADQTKLTAAYNHAKQNHLWADQYPMATKAEYFAVGASVFFNVDHLDYHGNGNHMATCGQQACKTEADSRAHLYRIDSQLYNILNHVYTNNQPGYYPHIGNCGAICH